ncbi:MAG: DUF86 domain-containing protein [Ignavibacteriaceae bacterium]|nr:DUF86 domain-containing protein [Ignavibacteriaceae bacterium]
MLNNELLIEISKQILSSIQTIEKRMKTIKASEDFLKNDRNLERLDSICMQLVALGESIKNLDKVTNKLLFKKYPEFEWKKAMGMRDVLSHHYFDLNSDIVFDVCINEIPKLKKIIKLILDSPNNPTIILP